MFLGHPDEIPRILKSIRVWKMSIFANFSIFCILVNKISVRILKSSQIYNSPFDHKQHTTSSGWYKGDSILLNLKQYLIHSHFALQIDFYRILHWRIANHPRLGVIQCVSCESQGNLLPTVKSDPGCHKIFNIKLLSSPTALPF
jgi:hypothetical protein